MNSLTQVVLINLLICQGGYGQPQCAYYRACLAEYGIRLTKDGRRMRKIIIERQEVTWKNKCAKKQ